MQKKYYDAVMDLMHLVINGGITEFNDKELENIVANLETINDFVDIMVENKDIIHSNTEAINSIILNDKVKEDLQANLETLVHGATDKLSEVAPEEIPKVHEVLNIMAGYIQDMKTASMN